MTIAWKGSLGHARELKEVKASACREMRRYLSATSLRLSDLMKVEKHAALARDNSKVTPR